MKKLSTISFTLLFSYLCIGQCVINKDNTHSFLYNNKTYQIVKEKKTWRKAADCAKEKGGYLAEINDEKEQNIIYEELNKAGIDNSEIMVNDGGGASYVWLGGNDLKSEGEWVWDGNNDGEGTPFWKGKENGVSVNGAYEKWGYEPDDFFDAQDGLALALTNWPRGKAGEWNDINVINEIYYVIEYDKTLSVQDLGFYDDNTIKVYPNPVKKSFTIENKDNQINKILVYNVEGKELKNINFNKVGKKTINTEDLPNGVYLIKIQTKDNKSILKKIIK